MKIPFYSNTRDDMHCVQACLESVLKYYFSHKNYSLRYLDRVTAHQKGKFTWPYAMALFLVKKGLEFIFIDNSDHRKFAQLGENFLRKTLHPKYFAIQKKYSNLKKEQKLARAILEEKNIKIINRPARLSDIQKLFRDNYLILCSINPNIINNRKGDWTHLVLVTDVKSKQITFHDSGLPSQPYRKTTIKKFMKAFGCPNRKAASLMATRFVGKK